VCLLLRIAPTGFAGGFSVTALSFRFTVLRISRDRGDCASPLHLGERNCTSTGTPSYQDLAVSTLLPGCEAMSRERIAASPCMWLSHIPTTMPDLTACRALDVSVRVSPAYSPLSFASLAGLRVSQERTQTECLGGVLLNAPSPLWAPHLPPG